MTESGCPFSSPNEAGTLEALHLNDLLGFPASSPPVPKRVKGHQLDRPVPVIVLGALNVLRFVIPIREVLVIVR